MSTLSVVIPTRNRSALLATTVRSVLSQRDVDLEVIVVDDASSDDTAAVVDSFADHRLAMIRKATPSGPGAARNEGAARAAGEWIGFIDDDDVWAPDKLARQVAAAQQAGRLWAYTGAVTIGGGFEILSGTPPLAPEAVVAALPRFNPIPGGGSNVIIRRHLLAEAGGFDEQLPPCEDWDLWIRLARSGLPALAAHPLVGYRVHGGNSSLDLERILRAARVIEKRQGTSIDWGRMHRWLAESCLRREWHMKAIGQFGRAAVRGQALSVVSDISAILKRKIARLTVGYRFEGAVMDAAWAAEASAWLGELERSLRPRAERVDPPAYRL